MMLNEIINTDTLFQLSSQFALLGWAILLFLPRGLKLLTAIPQYLIPLGLSLLYSSIILLHFFTAEGGFSSLSALRLLFENDQMLLAGWIHYLAFDLFIGAWIAKEADKIAITRVIQIPILITTFMLGPIGLILFLIMRTLITKMEKSNHA